jgi:hypothetical protein
MRSGENKIYDLLVMLKALIQVWLFFSIIFLLISNKSFAGNPVEIISDGEYVMGAGETMEVAEEKAKKVCNAEGCRTGWGICKELYKGEKPCP